MESDDLKLGDLVDKYQDGSVRKFTLPSGTEFEAYIPDNYTTNTNVLIYEHGMGGYYNDWSSYVEKFKSGKCDSIVIRANHNGNLNLYNYIVDNYNLSGNNKMMVSFSSGTMFAFEETIQMIKQNPSTNAPISVVLDGHIPIEHLKQTGAIDTLKDANALVLAVSRPGADGERFRQRYLQLAESGVNVAILTDKSDYGKSHVGINDSFMSGNLYDYVVGNSILPDRYEISVYDNNIGQFISVKYDDIATINGFYNYFGVKRDSFTTSVVSPFIDFSIISSTVAVRYFLGPIAREIRNTHFFRTKFDLDSFSSTTKVPSFITPLVQKYYIETEKNLDKLSAFVKDVAQIEPTYLKTDKELFKFIENTIKK